MPTTKRNCLHLTVEISESCAEVQTHYFKDGKYIETESAIGMETSTLNIYCPVCGLERNYSKYRKKPKWLRNYWRQIRWRYNQRDPCTSQ